MSGWEAIPATLHLVSGDLDEQTREALRLLTGTNARSVVRPIRRTGSGLVRDFRWLRSSEARRFDLVHCWGALPLAVAAVATRAPLIVSPVGFPGKRFCRLVGATNGRRRLRVVVWSELIRRAMVRRGVAPASCGVVYPGVDLSRIPRGGRDEKLRAELGFEPGDRVLLGVGESTVESDHRSTFWAAGVLFMLEQRNKLLLWGEGPRAAAVETFARRTTIPLLTTAKLKLGRSVTFNELLGVADGVLVTASGPMTFDPLLRCMARGLPIVSTIWPGCGEVLEDRYNALFSVSSRPKVVARRVLDLWEDDELGERISRQARADVFEHFSATKFIDRWAEEYATLLQQPASRETTGPTRSLPRLAESPAV